VQIVQKIPYQPVQLKGWGFSQWRFFKQLHSSFKQCLCCIW